MQCKSCLAAAIVPTGNYLFADALRLLYKHSKRKTTPGEVLLKNPVVPKFSRVPRH